MVIINYNYHYNFHCFNLIADLLNLVNFPLIMRLNQTLKIMTKFRLFIPHQ